MGKTTIADLLLADQRFARVVTATTRAPRGEEQEGVHYRFLTMEEFRSAIDLSELLEHARVHEHYYGTPRENVERIIRTGQHALLLIDVQGAAQVRSSAEEALFVFVAPPSLEELERRLRGRETETETQIRGRMEVAKREMLKADGYDHVVINDRAEAAAARIKEIAFRDEGAIGEAGENV